MTPPTLPSSSLTSSTSSSAQQGRVVFVTDKRAYLDKGRRAGLREKQVLKLARGPRPIGSCTIEAVADRQATCVGVALRPGDTFRAPGKSGGEGPTFASATVLPPVTDEATLSRRVERIAESRYEKVDFAGARSSAGRARVFVSPLIARWQMRSDGADSVSLQQLDGSVAGYELGASGLRLDAAFSAARWGGGTNMGRFRPGDSTQFYLWQLELSRRPITIAGDGSSIVFAAGRIWPWHLPGLTMLDGVQIGRRDRAGSLEGGVYAGLLPTAIGLAPSADAWAAGFYGSLTQIGEPRGLFRLARQSARMGVLGLPGAGWTGDVEATSELWLGPTSVAAGGRVRFAGALGPRPVVDRAHFDFSVRPSAMLGGGVHVRYLGLPALDPAALAGVVPALAGTVRAAADVHAHPVAWLGVAAAAGVHHDRSSAREQRQASGELRLPRLMGSLGGVAVGAELQEGWLRVRALYAQAVARIGSVVTAFGRASATATQFETPATLTDAHEVGGTFAIDGAFSDRLRLRAWGALRVPWMMQGEPTPFSQVGFISGAALSGLF